MVVKPGPDLLLPNKSHISSSRKLCRTSAPCLQIEAGTTEFTPTPSESRALISRSYSVPRTLLVRFVDDSIDATADIAPVLKLRHPEGGCPSHNTAGLMFCLQGKEVWLPSDQQQGSGPHSMCYLPSVMHWQTQGYTSPTSETVHLSGQSLQFQTQLTSWCATCH